MMPSNSLEFLAAFLPGEDRVLTRTGVEIHRLQYWADGLAQWVGQRVAVRVHYDSRDITYVFVRTPVGSLVKALVTTPGVKAISLGEWAARRQHERALCRDPALVAQADESLRRNEITVKQAKDSRAIRRRQATAAAGDRFRDASHPTQLENPQATDNIPVLIGPLEPFGHEEIDYDI